MWSYKETELEQVERVFTPVCSVPFFQHETSVQATLVLGRLVNIYKVQESFVDNAIALSYWVCAIPGERQLECSCSLHRCTGQMCHHIAAVLLYKWFELTGETPAQPPTTPVAGMGNGPLALRQAREIVFLHFEFEPTTRQKLLELRQHYQITNSNEKSPD